MPIINRNPPKFPEHIYPKNKLKSLIKFAEHIIIMKKPKKTFRNPYTPAAKKRKAGAMKSKKSKPVKVLMSDVIKELGNPNTWNTEDIEYQKSINNKENFGMNISIDQFIDSLAKIARELPLLIEDWNTIEPDLQEEYVDQLRWMLGKSSELLEMKISASQRLDINVYLVSIEKIQKENGWYVRGYND